jgi:hypothetical protein
VPVGGMPTRARVVAADDAGVELAAEPGTPSRHEWAELGRGTVQIEFGRADAEDAEDDGDEPDAEEEES